jgi:hypothetical protein
VARRARLILSGVPQHLIQRGNSELDSGELGEIRETVNRGWPLGGERFKDGIESALKCAARPPKRGRPARLAMPNEQGQRCI